MKKKQLNVKAKAVGDKPTKKMKTTIHVVVAVGLAHPTTLLLY